MLEDLGFVVTAEPDGHERCLVTARKDNVAVAWERYRIGDSAACRTVAETWAADDRLRGGRDILVEDVVRALQEAEEHVICQVAEDRYEDDAREEATSPVRRASHVDEKVMAELAWNAERSRPDFIALDRQKKTTSRTERVYGAEGLIVVPSSWKGMVTPGHPIQGNVLVPTKCSLGSCDGKRLRGDIRAFIERYVELSVEGIAIAAEYVLLTWVYDRFNELPYLAFRSPEYGRGKSRALETVGSICYRPLLVGGGSTPASVLRMLDQLGGTLVADEFEKDENPELGSTVRCILNQGFQRNKPLVKCQGENFDPRAFQCYGPKVFALRGRLGDDATESRTIWVVMESRSRDNIPLNLPRERFDGEALALRNRLLAWRFVHYDEIEVDPSLAQKELEDRANQIGLPLFSVARDEQSRAQIIAAFKRRQRSIHEDRAETRAGQVLRAILEIAQPGDTVRPGDVAGRLAGQSGSLSTQSSAQRAGRIMAKELGLPPAEPRRDNSGARYRLDPRRLRQLCKHYGYPFPETPQTSPTSQRHAVPDSGDGPQDASLCSGTCSEGSDDSDESDVSQEGPDDASAE